MHFHACRIERRFTPKYSEQWFVLTRDDTQGEAQDAAADDEAAYAPVDGVTAEWLVTGPCDCTPPDVEQS